MAATVSIAKAGVPGAEKWVFVDITFDASYPTGGESVTPAQLGLSEVIAAWQAGLAGGYVLSYNRSTSKVQAYMGDNNNSNDAPGVEAGDTSDLSAVTARMVFVGR